LGSPATGAGQIINPITTAARFTTHPGVARHRLGRGMELAHQSPRFVSGVRGGPASAGSFIRPLAGLRQGQDRDKTAACARSSDLRADTGGSFRADAASGKLAADDRGIGFAKTADLQIVGPSGALARAVRGVRFVVLGPSLRSPARNTRGTGCARFEPQPCPCSCTVLRKRTFAVGASNPEKLLWQGLLNGAAGQD
jgi:hypothetical protein